MKLPCSRILFLAHLLPWPLEGGGQIKSYHTLRILASAYEVKLLAFTRRGEEESEENLAPLRELCRGGVRTVRLPRGKPRDVAALTKALLRGRSFLVFRDGEPAMHAAVKRELATGAYAAVHVDHLQMMQFIPESTPGVKVVLDNHNVEHRIPLRMAETHSLAPARPLLRREAEYLKRFEARACRRADRVLTVSEEDAQGLLMIAPDTDGTLYPVAIGVDTDYFGAAPPRQPSAMDLLSIGTMYWPPNIDSMLYFYADIFPLIRARIPEARLCIVGARPTEAVRALAARDTAVTVTGAVPDVRPYAADCGAFVVPLRSGSGMRVKILNALAMGLPVVSTTLGAEGIDVRDGEHVLLADTPPAFANAVVRLLTEPGLAAKLGEAGRRLMHERYSWEVVGRQLLAVYADLIPSSHSGAAAVS